MMSHSVAGSCLATARARSIAPHSPLPLRERIAPCPSRQRGTAHRPFHKPRRQRRYRTLTRAMAEVVLPEGLGKRVLVVGGNRGLGLEMVKYLVKGGCEVAVSCRKSNEALDGAGCEQVIQGIDFMDDEVGVKLAGELRGNVDTLMMVAGYWSTETLETPMSGAEQRKMYQICAIAPLLIMQHLVLTGKLGKGSKIGFITSEGGSIGLRSEKESGNYAHHASKAASNSVGRMLSFDLKHRDVALVMLHPGFLKTEMTKPYEHLYEELGAIEPQEALPSILKAVGDLTLETTGRFIAPLGASGLGLGIYALPDPDNVPPFSELPW
ncbi:hypothetical protein BSKO_12961 [Bryopsis sp. KO-2023]|nr:hypothetical protein BSKO_12961 [Bryopsis sp. KO-2023]